jgi:UDP-glucose 4-epimerase
VIGAASLVAGRNIPVVVGPRRPGDPPVLTADAGLAARDLGWRARRPTIEDMITPAWRWLQARSGAPPQDKAASAA